MLMRKYSCCDQDQESGRSSKLRLLWAKCQNAMQQTHLLATPLSTEEGTQDQAEQPTDIGLYFFQGKGQKLDVSQGFHTPEPGLLRHHLGHILWFCSHFYCWIQKLCLEIGSPLLAPDYCMLKTTVEHFKWLGSEAIIPLLFFDQHLT